MIRSAAGKVMWVGKATVFLVGLAVILAVLFGVASTAFAHKADRGLFHIGHTNAGKALSTLVGTLTTPILKVDNNGTGPALQLEAGNAAGTAPDTVAPMSVNPEAGTATGLSADELDGEDSANYLPGDLPPGTTVRGAFIVNFYATAASQRGHDALSFGYRLPSSPNLRYINVGEAVPAGCSGTPSDPGADPGYLCVFESYKDNVNTSRGVAPISSAGERTGAIAYAFSANAGEASAFGTWAVTAPTG